MLREFIAKLKGKKTGNDLSSLRNIPTPVTDHPVFKDLDVLVLADTHGTLSDEKLRRSLKTPPDMILILGDIYYQNLELFFSVLNSLKMTDIPILGILGNHDDKDLFSYFPRIKDMDGKREVLSVKGKELSVAGLSGSIRYKYSDHYVLRTHKESVEILDPLESCDLLMTHDKPCFIKPDDFEYDELCKDAHSGLYGIGKYITKKKPQLVLHGHTHNPMISKYEDSYIRCCYGVERFRI